MAKSSQKKESAAGKVICENRKARFDYEVIDTFEAGLVLTGAEIKSIRQNGISINESYVRPDGTELVVVQMHIKPYAFDADPKYDPMKKRKLLLHRSEINRLIGSIQRKGLTIVPLKVYLKRGYAKVLIGLARGKASPDKRQNTKEREASRELLRAIKSKKK